MNKSPGTHLKLNQVQATAICGNDISSSCLYVSALTIVYASQYAWVSLLIVALVLFLFRKIYGEVVGAATKWWSVQCSFKYNFQTAGIGCRMSYYSFLYNNSGNFCIRSNALSPRYYPCFTAANSHCLFACNFYDSGHHWDW